MRDKRLIVGFAISAGWIALAVFMLVAQERPTRLNEWGDFIAGFSAPLAFFWLVLGYLQQGEELKQSTKALRLQADELKQSVEQQSNLVELSRKQMQHEIEKLEEDRRRYREAVRPTFVPQQSSIVHNAQTGEVAAFHISIVNIGRPATRVRMRFEIDGTLADSVNRAIFSSEENVRVSLPLAKGRLSNATIDYVDASGLPGRCEFQIRAVREKTLEFSDTVLVL
ncbi:hypothetical protein [Variovorax guangxiensis]|uniref:Uncharacterized protein n=1 Tax=Variovorax guangxiensis TaxID=1775474 RepID=A0A840FRE0_9BURK|nr:hypothetical protein [Variovorax guangxiensis]MBB4223442.1 hypothetical protein [Variovorax guangxiensis]